MPSRLELPAVMLYPVGRPTTTRGALTGDLNPEIKGACLCIRLRCGLSEFDEIAEQKVHGPCAGMIFAHAREKSLLSNRDVQNHCLRDVCVLLKERPCHEYC